MGVEDIQYTSLLDFGSRPGEQWPNINNFLVATITQLVFLPKKSRLPLKQQPRPELTYLDTNWQRSKMQSANANTRQKACVLKKCINQQSVCHCHLEGTSEPIQLKEICHLKLQQRARPLPNLSHKHIICLGDW